MFQMQWVILVVGFNVNKGGAAVGENEVILVLYVGTLIIRNPYIKIKSKNICLWPFSFRSFQQPTTKIISKLFEKKKKKCNSQFK